jgi:hypothetical protein
MGAYIEQVICDDDFLLHQRPLAGRQFSGGWQGFTQPVGCTVGKNVPMLTRANFPAPETDHGNLFCQFQCKAFSASSATGRYT